MKKILLFLICLILFAGLMISCDTNSSTTTSDYSPPPKVRYPTVKYEVTGTAYAVDITLQNPTGGTEQYSNAGLPSEFTYNDFKDSFLYISAQNQGNRGKVTVSIYVDGTLYKTASSSGAYVIATASGSRP